MVMRAESVVVGLLLLGLAPLSASGQEIGNPYRGQVYARQLCSDCHSVERVADKSPAAAAPAFATVGKTSGMTAMALAAWMTTSHPTMPNLVVRGEKLDDIIAYILSIKDQPQG